MSAPHAGSPADFSTALLNAVVEHVRQSARGVQFIDAAIPDCRLTALAHDCVMLRIETGTAQDALTRGFRADGGHSELRSCTPETLAAVIGQRTGWIYCGDRPSAGTPPKRGSRLAQGRAASRGAERERHRRQS